MKLMGIKSAKRMYKMVTSASLWADLGQARATLRHLRSLCAHFGGTLGAPWVYEGSLGSRLGYFGITLDV